jgi:hypothetical protein
MLVAFLLELIVFYFFAALPFAFAIPRYLQITICLGLLASLVFFWSIFMAPRASRKLHSTRYYIAKSAIYTVASISILLLVGRLYFILFIVSVIIDEAYFVIVEV